MLSKGFIYMCIPIDFYILVTYWKQGKQIMRLTECLLTLTETQDTVLDLHERTYRNCEYKNWGRIGWGMQLCVVNLFAEILLMTVIEFQLNFMALYLCINILHWKIMLTVTYISGFRFNSYTKYFYLSTISTPRSEKSNREGMYWIRMRHGYCLDTQTRIKAHQNAI